MTSEQSLRLFDLVNRNFKDEADARAFVKELDAIVSERAKEEARSLATKEDMVREISNAKIDLIKWMFGFWAVLVMLILGAFFLKK